MAGEGGTVGLSAPKDTLYRGIIAFFEGFCQSQIEARGSGVDFYNWDKWDTFAGVSPCVSFQILLDVLQMLFVSFCKMNLSFAVVQVIKIFAVF